MLVPSDLMSLCEKQLPLRTPSRAFSVPFQFVVQHKWITVWSTSSRRVVMWLKKKKKPLVCSFCAYSRGEEKKDSRGVPQQRQTKDNQQETDKGWGADQKPVFAFRVLVRNPTVLKREKYKTKELINDNSPLLAKLHQNTTKQSWALQPSHWKL